MVSITINHRNSILLFVLFFICLSCNKPEVEKKIPSLDELTYLSQTPKFYIDFIDGELVRDADSNFIIDIDNKKEIEIMGWAIDAPNESLASNVYLVINHQIFGCDYHVKRTDVANTFKNNALENCGFVSTIPTEKLSKGVYDFSILVEAKNGGGVYSFRKKDGLIID